MAGLYFGKSRWDDIPQTLGLTAQDDGRMTGLWRGHPVLAYFENQHDEHRDTYDHITSVWLKFDPLLGVVGLENDELFDRIAEPALRTEVRTRATALGLRDVLIGDGGLSGRWWSYESGVERYRAVFELFAWAAQIILERRAIHLPAWEREIGAAWPPLAQGWGLELDVRRGEMRGTVRGRATSARIVNNCGSLTTGVDVEVLLPPGCELSLARQKGGDGFFDRLFRGQDVKLGDPDFDAAFVIKGKSEAFVHAALNPVARQQILELAHSGCSITLKDGKLATWTKQVVTSREELDELMKSAYSAALALCPQPTLDTPAAPYR